MLLFPSSSEYNKVNPAGPLHLSRSVVQSQSEGDQSIKFSASKVETHARIKKALLAALSSREATQQAWLAAGEGFGDTMLIRGASNKDRHNSERKLKKKKTHGKELHWAKLEMAVCSGEIFSPFYSQLWTPTFSNFAVVPAHLLSLCIKYKGSQKPAEIVLLPVFPA